MRFFFAGPRILGQRIGVSFGPEDLRRLKASSAATQERRASAFVYVIRKAISGHVKIGIAADPTERLRTLQTGSSEPLEIVYACAVQSNNGVSVELATHDILQKYRLTGEWFEVSPEIAVAAIAAASHRLNDPIVQIPVNRIGDVVAIATQRDTASQPRKPWSPVRVFATIFGLAVIFAIGFVAVLNR